MKKALRVGYNQYYTDEEFFKHLEYVKANIDVIDEITMFAGFSHYGYRTIEAEMESAEVIRKRIKSYKEAGVKSVGVDVLASIGHIEEGWGVLPASPLRFKMNENGVESKSCLCPGNDAFLEHTAKRYGILADVGADFIWMDDDFRLCDHGVVQNYCYCDDCIANFNKQKGTSCSREEISEQVHNNPEFAKEWDEFHSDILVKAFEAVERGVHSVNPDVKIGYMSIPSNTRTDWMIKSGSEKLRPGDGFYTDEHPMNLFTKCYTLQDQIRETPDYITDIQYEYEAFNYQTMEKSEHISELETTLALMSGCRGALYNDNLFFDRISTTDMLRRCRGRMELITRNNENCTPCGVYCKDNMVARMFNEIGVPITRYKENAVMEIVTGSDIKKLSDNEIEALGNVNLLTDGEGVELLNERGFGNIICGSVKKRYDNGMAERFSDNELNGSYKNHYRDIFMNFKREHGNPDAYELEPYEGATVLSRLETITHIPGDTSMYIKEAGQRRVAADGYLIPPAIKSAPKREQLLNVLDRVSFNKLPVMIDKAVKVMPSVMSDKNGGMNIMLVNASFDATGVIKCTIRNDKEFYLIAENGELIKAKQTHNGGETVVSLDNIPAWGYVVMTNKL